MIKNHSNFKYFNAITKWHTQKVSRRKRNHNFEYDVCILLEKC